MFSINLNDNGFKKYVIVRVILIGINFNFPSISLLSQRASGSTQRTSTTKLALKKDVGDYPNRNL